MIGEWKQVRRTERVHGVGSVLQHVADVASLRVDVAANVKHFGGAKGQKLVEERFVATFARWINDDRRLR